jgi:2-dehydro-3-deoxyphosphogluconate aldolase/(4S)-4-hydroxy-2-oxoglutarate aldolase
MIMGQQSLDKILEGRKIIAVLRGKDAAKYHDVIATLVRAGVNGIELTLTTPGTLDALEALRARFGESARIGVGTVLDAKSAREAIDRGAEYIVAPNLNPEVIGVAVESDTPVLPGVLTPTEVQTALDLGASTVKIFPAQTVGADYLKHLRGPFPNLQAVPSGGVGLEAARAWLSAGASAVSVGGPLLGNVFKTGDVDELRSTATDFVKKLEAHQ